MTSTFIVVYTSDIYALTIKSGLPMTGLSAMQNYLHSESKSTDSSFLLTILPESNSHTLFYFSTTELATVNWSLTGYYKILLLNVAS